MGTTKAVTDATFVDEVLMSQTPSWSTSGPSGAGRACASRRCSRRSPARWATR